MLGTIMVSLGVLPTGLFLVGRGQALLFLGSASVLPERFRMLLVVVVCVCGPFVFGLGAKSQADGYLNS
jgi:hypothetical protein